MHIYIDFFFKKIKMKNKFQNLVLVIVDHFVWFNYFTRNYFPFDEIVCFFAICVWAVPFELFISLSANDNTLPYGKIELLF